MADCPKVTLDTPMTTSHEPKKGLSREEIQAMRRSYGEIGLIEEQMSLDPFEQFHQWLLDARDNSYIIESNAMVLSTLGAHGPESRTVLLKDVSEAGFSFFTNYQSAKGRAISADPRVGLLFPWYPMERQVIIQGKASRVARKVSEDYFSTRPWSSQIGAWASEQSNDLESREELQARYQHFASLYPEGSPVPTPPHWGGYLVVPESIEFWQGRYSRLHDRIKYTATDAGWGRSRLHP